MRKREQDRKCCSCRRRGGRYSPKVARSVCHGDNYHPCVVERIEGKRLCRAVMREPDALDFEG